MLAHLYIPQCTANRATSLSPYKILMVVAYTVKLPGAHLQMHWNARRKVLQWAAASVQSL
jgi:hypothetical protein